MTGTKSFEQLPDHQKKCLVHIREECQTQKYLDHVQKECKCIPWSLEIDHQAKKNKVKTPLKLFQFGRCLPSVAERRRIVLQTKL